jgi:hypothetical protein
MTLLGRLERIDPRVVWTNEARDFTPWLLQHADHLAEALRIDLELEAAEHPVGGYSLDLIGRDLTNDAVLIVENQIGDTDHSHLGQVLTYAAGTGASTIVWIATAFREEHRQALDWLNQSTGDDTHFFGLELEVVRIGDSLPAPLFNAVAEPNQWQKRVRATTRATNASGGKRGLYIEFWTRFLERLRAEHPTWSRARAAGPDNWFAMACPIKGGSYYSATFAGGSRLRFELYIDQGDAMENATIFDHFLGQRTEMEALYGSELSFERLEGRRACRIADYTSGDVTNRDDWESYIDWFFESGRRLRTAVEATHAR